MLLLVGLGNPGTRYAGNRHNIGFMAVEAIARRYNIAPWRNAKHSLTARGDLYRQQAVLVKPETYMNESGRAVVETAQFFKIRREDIFVFHDEIELPFGKVRVKVGGSDAGHNGLRSITEHIGPQYKRVRLGVGRPLAKHLVESYVLGDFSLHERPLVQLLCEVVADNMPLLVEHQDSSFQNKIHLAMESHGLR